MKPKQITQLWLITIAMIALFALSAAPGYSATVYDDASCVSYWKYDDQTANDSKGANNGTVTNAVWTSSGKVGGAYYFDGNVDCILASTLTWTPASFTIAWWHMPYAIDYTGQIISSQPGYWGGFYFHIISPGSIYVGTDASERFTPTNLPSTMTLNEWQYFVYTYDGTNGRFYKNGVLLAGPKTQNPSTAWHGLYIGGNGIQAINGLIDEVAIWNSALGVDDVKTLYYSGQVADAAAGLSLNYTPTEIEDIAQMYFSPSHTPVITSDNVTWSYAFEAGGLPGQGAHVAGDSWEFGGKKYLLLQVGSGGGAVGETGGGVPEPATVVGLVLAGLGIAARKLKKCKV
jgi:hypothetical protein